MDTIVGHHPADLKVEFAGRLQSLATMSAVILWDMDGTLVDSEPLHEQALLATLADEGISPPHDLHAQLLGLSADAIHALFRSRFGLRRSLEDWLRRRWSVYLEGVAGLRARPGALEVFEAAEALGWQQAVVSNSPRVVVDANLKAIGLEKRVKEIVAAEDVTYPKPHPDPYLLAQRRLVSEPCAVFAVEDSSTGTRAALAAGCRTFYWPQAAQASLPGAIHISGNSVSLWESFLREARTG